MTDGRAQRTPLSEYSGSSSVLGPSNVRQQNVAAGSVLRDRSSRTNSDDRAQVIARQISVQSIALVVS
jgi:hypothetical protein